MKAQPLARTGESRQPAASHSATVQKAPDKSAFVDNRREAIAQRQLADAVDQSPYMVAQRKRLGRRSDEATAQLQRGSAPASNDTGLPGNLKSGIESLSGLSLDHVKVHYNSSHPARLDALAYTQGSDIHVARGQERHLPHEAWHVVQQAQGRVKPTLQAKGVAINDSKALEEEADLMGTKALQARWPAPDFTGTFPDTRLSARRKQAPPRELENSPSTTEAPGEHVRVNFAATVQRAGDPEGLMKTHSVPNLKLTNHHIIPENKLHKLWKALVKKKHVRYLTSGLKSVVEKGYKQLDITIPFNARLVLHQEFHWIPIDKYTVPFMGA